MVGITESLARNVPGLIPRNTLLVDEQAHQFCHSDSRMGVVELHGELLVESFHRNLLATHYPHHVLQRAGDEEILLLEPKFFALDRLVVGIENLGEILRDDFFVHCAIVVATVEHLEIERLWRFSAPQAKCIGRVRVVAEDRRVVRQTNDDAPGYPTHTMTSFIVGPRLGGAADFDFDRPLGARDVPGCAEAQPFVRAFHLPAVDDLLLENTELVADAVTHCRDLQRCHRVEEACGQASQAAVAQSRLLLLLQQVVEVQPQFRDRLLDLMVDAQVDQIVAQVWPDQELSRQVGHRAGALLGVLRGCTDPALQEAVAHDIRQRQVVVALGRKGGELALHVEKVIEERTLQGLLTEGRAFVLLQGRARCARNKHVHGFPYFSLPRLGRFS